ncbi:MAG: hypothetical protein K2N51_10350 [Lachnospiraceae bacterium]|nr:hypothetical protein [Lachnospiraceae bacterium]
MGKELTKEDRIIELLEMLSSQNMQKKMDNFFQFCAYVDDLENKIAAMQTEIEQMKQGRTGKPKESRFVRMKAGIQAEMEQLLEMLQPMKVQVKEIKDGILAKVTDITNEAKAKGKAVLHRMSEFVGIKDKLQSLQENVQTAQAKAEHTIDKLEVFGKGMRQANRKIANTVRILFDRETVDYRKKEKKISKTQIALKPLQGISFLLKDMDQTLYSAIQKVEGLQVEPKIEQKQKPKENTGRVQGDANRMPMVSEQEVQYGADLFEQYQKKQTESKKVEKAECKSRQPKEKDYKR